MANYCDTTYRIVGEASELDTLQSLMETLKKEKEHGNWVGHLVSALHDTVPEGFYMRGWWDSLERDEHGIMFHLESAWVPMYETWDFICSKFETLRVYFIAEEPGCEIFLKRDCNERPFFPTNYYVDSMDPDGDFHSEYFRTIDEAFRYIEKFAGVNIITAEDVEALNANWNEKKEGAFIYLHEYKEI